MEEKPTLAQRMYELYKCNERSSGYYDPKTGKGFTKHQSIRVQDFQNHIEGVMGCGAVAILDDATCYWGAIDIDNHGSDEDIPIMPVEQRIREMRLPLIPCRSKSGGIHCYIFFEKPVAAIRARLLLEEMARVIGFAGAEIFPKQNTLRIGESGTTRQLGNWINLPYLGGDQTMRYAIHNGRQLKLKDFLDLADKLKVTDDVLSQLLLIDHMHAPPCVQRMMVEGVGKGLRNEAAFQIGIYLRKAYPAEVEARMKRLNQHIFTSPLPRGEMMRTINSAQRPDYRYRCNMEPMTSLCDRETCLTRDYGITKDEYVDIEEQSTLPKFSGLIKFMTEPVRWELEVDGHKIINISTGQLLEWRFIREMIAEKLNRIVPMIKNPEWDRLLSKLMEEVRVIAAPDEASINGMIRARLREFASKTDLLNAGKDTDDRKALLRGLPCVQVINGERCVVFRQMDFVAFLKRTRSEDARGAAVWMAVKDIGVTHTKIRVGEKNLNVWIMPVDEVLREVSDVPPAEFETEL